MAGFVVCVKGIKANGRRRAAASVVSVLKSGLIFAGDVESPLLLVLLLLLLVVLRRRIAIAAVVAVGLGAAIYSM